MSSPPGYTPTEPYPQPSSTQPLRPGSVRHRKSSTIIPISSEASSSTDSIEISPARSTALLPDLATLPFAEEGRKHGNTPIPSYLHELERKHSNTSSLADAEEGEARPLLSDDGERVVSVGKWYQGPLFVAGVKFSLLFVVFTGLLLGTFYFGLPRFDP